ncbi:MAG: DUF4956 domain-containing protein [Oscillospiraceae bacterium]|nr:DUF4956 domain-containing protein [Oscillospiraceae bacterium]
MFNSIFTDGLSVEAFFIAILSSVAVGFLISLLYLVTNKKEGYSQSYVWTIIMLPPVVAIVIAAIGNNVASSLSLAGAFTLVRFRSAPGDPKQIAYVFYATATGLICGLGYITYAFIFLVIIAAVLLVLYKTKYASPATSSMTLKITIPENLNYIGLFDKTLDKYTSNWLLKRVKTTEFGTLFELIYSIEINNTANQKAFIDEIRTLNGNLNVVLVLYKYDDKVYAS